jgi:hypothetical protein
MRRKLKAPAHLAGMREPEMIRAAVKSHTGTEEERLHAHEQFRRAGAIGIVKDASPDLSTNPNHMDGFGES